MQSHDNIDGYIESFPASIQQLLGTVRKTIQQTVPEAKEAMKYGIPTFTLGGNLVHFAAFKNHIGLYPAPSAILAFKDELAEYNTSKGAIQFPIDKPLPLSLIRRIVEFRVKETEMKAKKKATKSSKEPRAKN